MAIDPIIKDHQLWIGFVQPEGLVVSPHALKNAQAVLSHNVGVQQEILRRHTVRDFGGNLRLKNFPAFTQEFWGWRESDLATPRPARLRRTNPPRLFPERRVLWPRHLSHPPDDDGAELAHAGRAAPS